MNNVELKVGDMSREQVPAQRVRPRANGASHREHAALEEAIINAR